MSSRPSRPHRVNAIIVAHSQQVFLETAADSIASQRYDLHKIDLTLIDDASEDESLRAMKRVRKRSMVRTRVLTNDTRLGDFACRRQALAETDGEFVFFMNPCAVLEPAAIRRLVEALNSSQEPRPAFAYSAYRNIHFTIPKNVQLLDEIPDPEFETRPVSPEIVTAETLGSGSGIPRCPLVRRTSIPEWVTSPETDDRDEVAMWLDILASGPGISLADLLFGEAVIPGSEDDREERG